MHSFYLDETGCTGADLTNPEQPIFVIGGIDVTDEKWRETRGLIQRTLEEFFAGHLPDKFELHADDLLNAKGFFSDKPRSERSALAHILLDLVAKRDQDSFCRD